MKEYSVTIRTLGTAGEKYQKTLDSIKWQTIPPKEVIVVLAKGYALPKERLGNETFLFSEKGMVSQRLAGIEACSSEYILAIDDDVEFKSDFISTMFTTIQETRADFASPIVKEHKQQSQQNKSMRMGGGKILRQIKD